MSHRQWGKEEGDCDGEGDGDGEGEEKIVSAKDFRFAPKLRHLFFLLPATKPTNGA